VRVICSLLPAHFASSPLCLLLDYSFLCCCRWCCICWCHWCVRGTVTNCVFAFGSVGPLIMIGLAAESGNCGNPIWGFLVGVSLLKVVYAVLHVCVLFAKSPVEKAKYRTAVYCCMAAYSIWLFFGIFWVYTEELCGGSAPYTMALLLVSYIPTYLSICLCFAALCHTNNKDPSFRPTACPSRSTCLPVFLPPSLF